MVPRPRPPCPSRWNWRRRTAVGIEIAVPVIYSEPVRIEVDDLLITSTVGGSTIIFQSHRCGDGTIEMLRIGEHQWSSTICISFGMFRRTGRRGGVVRAQ